jgi:hypothetical protein
MRRQFTPGHVAFEVLTAKAIVWVVTPCNPVECQRLPPSSVLGSKLSKEAGSKALKIEPERSTETSENFYGTTQCRIPEDGILFTGTRSLAMLYYSYRLNQACPTRRP